MDHILWDLDGTLTDPRQGIIRCFQHALESAGLPVPPEGELLWIIGPPLQQSFAQHLPELGESGILDLVARFRERFGEIGMFENEVYAGIPQLLSALQGRRMVIATSKPHVFARKIVGHFGLSEHFVEVYGSELDGRRVDKGELIRYVLERESIEPHRAVIVGDRKFDILGARKAGIASIGITWGYGSREELEAAGAGRIFDSPRELQGFLAG